MLPLGVDNQDNKLLSKITIFKDYVVIFQKMDDDGDADDFDLSHL